MFNVIFRHFLFSNDTEPSTEIQFNRITHNQQSTRQQIVLESSDDDEFEPSELLTGSGTGFVVKE